MRKPIINVADVKLEPRPPGLAPSGQAAQRYDARMGYIGPRIGAQKLGCNITAVAPGKRAFPFHHHYVNEEMFLVLQGAGEIRMGTEVYPIRAGDLIACPAGGADSAHQIVNTGPDELRYLAVSTKMSPEIAGYPDSGKFGVLAELPAGADDNPRRFMYVGREKESLDYWEGE